MVAAAPRRRAQRTLSQLHLLELLLTILADGDSGRLRARALQRIVRGWQDPGEFEMEISTASVSIIRYLGIEAMHHFGRVWFEGEIGAESKGISSRTCLLDSDQIDCTLITTDTHRIWYSKRHSRLPDDQKGMPSTKSCLSCDDVIETRHDICQHTPRSVWN